MRKKIYKLNKEIEKYKYNGKDNLARNIIKYTYLFLYPFIASLE